MSKNRNPILITGSHRSGTTWIGRTISQHHKIRYIQEPFHVTCPNKLMELKLDTWFTHAETSKQKNEIITSFNNLLQQRPIEYALATCKSAGLDIKTPLRFSKHLMLEYLFKPRILVKDPLALLSAGWLHETYNFKVICMIRNPFAFIGSLKVAGWDFDFENLRKQDGLMSGWLSEFSYDIESMCIQKNTHDFIDKATLLWNILHSVILKYQKQYPNWLFIKHENISENPEVGFQEIFNYLDLDINASIQSYIAKYTSKNNPIEVNNSYQPRNAELVLHTWKERLSDDEIHRIKVSTNNIASQFYENII